MKKTELVIAIALFLSIIPVQATDISGVTGNNGVYNITPEMMSGDVGFRQYENFNLSEGDVANLIFNKTTNGQNDKLESFVNLVNNKVDINGILNTVRNGEYYNGNAIFITPNGFTVGASGVLNVGSLSVATPTIATYNRLLDEYSKEDLQGINSQVPDLVHNSKGNAGAADINIQGKILARKGIDMSGKNVDVSGTIINGVTTKDPSHWRYNDDYDVVISSNQQAEQLFRSLVNSDGLMPRVQGDDEEFIDKFGNNGSQVYIKSTKGMNISGVVDNGDGSLYLTNNGNKGLTVTGTIDSIKEAKLLNTSGDLKADDNAYIQGRYTGVNITNSGKNLTLGEKTYVSSYKNIVITNNGSGKLTLSGYLLSGNEINNPYISNITITNKGSGMTIGGHVINSDESADLSELEIGKGNINITNYKGNLVLDGKIVNYSGDTNINNYGQNVIIKPDADFENYDGRLIIKNYKNNNNTFTSTKTSKDLGFNNLTINATKNYNSISYINLHQNTKLQK
ncbi:leukotoxin LktA family filamentous adhesin [bacterium]|nr:leukotoxin LktA family filamentous adhesin [bacterium]